MIKNDKQYGITKNKLKEFQSAFNEISKEPFISPLVKKARLNAIQSEIEIFENDIREYEVLKNSKPKNIEFNSLLEFCAGLIKMRISNGWSQSDLAKKLGVAEQQIQRYETNNYRTASLDKVAEIFQTFDVAFSGQIKKPIESKELFSPETLSKAKKVNLKIKNDRCLLF